MGKQTYTIQAKTKVEVWQNVTYRVKADSIEEAQKAIEKKPLSTAVDFETIEETETVIAIDFQNGGEGERVSVTYEKK